MKSSSRTSRKAAQRPRATSASPTAMRKEIAALRRTLARMEQRITTLDARLVTLHTPARPRGEKILERLNRMGIVGAVKDGPPDLSTNPKYLEGFGES